MSDRADRLIQDARRVEVLRQSNLSRLDVQIDGSLQYYAVTLRCTGIQLRAGLVRETAEHRVGIALGPDYPTRRPDLVWQSAIFHPNVRVPGVCLLGHWGHRTPLDEVVIWLWDMARYRLYNLKDPLDKQAADWARDNLLRFPLDDRSLVAVPHERAQSEAQIRERIRIQEG